MVLVVKCLICQKELTYIKGDPSPLVAHVKFDHPKIKNCVEPDAKETLDKAIEANLENISRKNFTFLNKSAQTDFERGDFHKMDQEEFPPLGQKIEKSEKKPQKNAQQQQPANINQIIKKHAPQPSTSYAHMLKSTDDDALQFGNFTRLDRGYRGADDDVSEKMPLLHPRSSFEPPATLPRDTSKDKIFIDSKKGQAHYSKDGNVQRTADKKLEERRNVLQCCDIHRAYYMKSLEKWKPVGDKKIHCPRCKAYKRPIVKAPSYTSVDSSVFAAFLRACFPLYCSPCCILSPPKFEYLYCPICDFHLGVYDHQKQTVFHEL